MTTDPSSGSPRILPFHLGLPAGPWMATRVQAIVEEAEVRGTQLDDPAAFLLLAQVGATLMDLRPEGPGGAPGETPEAGLSQELFHSFGLFLFQAFHLLRPAVDEVGEAAGVLLEVDTEQVQALVDPAMSVDASRWRLPAQAGYLALPLNRFWARPQGPEAPAEAVDGIGWVARPGEPAALSLVAITGVIPGRPGFSVLPIPPVPLADAPGWVSTQARSSEMGGDFAPNLPGAELGGLFGIETAGELLKLLARAVTLVGDGVLKVRTFPSIPTEAGGEHAP